MSQNIDHVKFHIASAVIRTWLNGALEDFDSLARSEALESFIKLDGETHQAVLDTVDDLLSRGKASFWAPQAFGDDSIIIKD